MSIFEKLDPFVEKLHLAEFNEVKPLQLVSSKVGQGCKPAHLVLAGSVVVVVMMALSIASFVLCSMVGFLYPAYKSFKALTSKQEDDDKQWLTYWIVFSFFTCFDSLLSTILFFLPMYYFIKLTFYVYLFHPKTQGAMFLYQQFFKPLFTKYEGKIDQSLKEGQQKVEGFINKAAQNISQ